MIKRFDNYAQYVLVLGFSLLIGGVVGAITAVFGRVLLFLTAFRSDYIAYLLPFLSIVGLFIVFVYQKFGGKSVKGMGLVFEVGHGNEETIPKRLVPLVILTTWLTHLFGGSAGREGVAVQIGATVSHYFQKYCRLQNASQLFLVMGMAAGFAGLFQTPLAATFFAIEVLVVGRLMVSYVLPSLIAALTANFVSHSLGLEKFSHSIATSMALTPDIILKLLVLGLCFGLCGNLFAYLLTKAKLIASSRLLNPYKRIFTLGLLSTFLLFIFHFGRYSGLGTNLIEASFTNKNLYDYDWLLKLCLTVITLAAGYQGGEVTPLFAIGASLGVIIAPILGLPVILVAALGYTSVFGSATNTLLGPILIGGEVFGFANTPYFVIVCLVAYSISHAHTIYGAQSR
ncbi:voltage-gated chloride channel family protein [Streptococcus sp. R4]|uniref:voltage-gated chloride channel family protein n=1 Tax=Streptococcus TaxID=1301 RepID=UPI0002BA4F57|nr:voltage-gated chloride channel family protein [Streptococcus agalactiae]MEE3843652.1 voltage-gated chloride channel family protein [Streptococcus sp. R4]EPV37065.1 voltage-gated chloride channel protein [Streptococcus agalactiae GB00888]EPW77548.1 voltage-gated chloride channel protein [Streptococcus agalactiae BSU174]MEB3018338.1 voltage-gated chloride channel family protein [Streptococcus agalactiae]MEC3713680.1 voltage-gated chloride channel family protein [Streptococcus agalactiae]